MHPVFTAGFSDAVQCPLADAWDIALLPAGTADGPEAISQRATQWLAANVPGTAMSALFAASQASFSQLPAIDNHDVWYRCTFDVESPVAPMQHHLCFDGLATLADVWLNGTHILASENMFLGHEVDVSAQLLPGSNQLVIRCAAVAQAVQTRRPRPRWRTRLVEQQQLRWIRTSLLGRIPGWSPAVPAAGPWRPVTLRSSDTFFWQSLDAQASLRATDGVVQIDGHIVAVSDNVHLLGAVLQVGDTQARMQLSANQGPGTDTRPTWRIEGEIRIPDVRRWWPHTHGEPSLHSVKLVMDTSAGEVRCDLGRTGFRNVELRTDDDDFAIAVNGMPVFCRGACWTTTDILTLAGTEAAARDTLLLARDAGMNMLRIGGTMFYEADHFYAICDELGILVWQDWMFANMDYPSDDGAFVASVETEARQFLQRTQLSPCLALLCGNSEVEQQAAMLGVDHALWRHPLFSKTLPAIGSTLRPDVPYWPSSPAGGVLPFQVDAGAAHYFGVGAYLQPTTDARRSGLRFASECLAFANIPEPDNLELLSPAGSVPPQHPLWKSRVARDSGAGWDFDDVRDHYLADLFGVDPARLRYANVDRYLALGRVASGEVMASAFREWRRNGSSCSGALVWFMRDLWPGAGWGVVDSGGQPKAAWYYLQRALAPVALFALDEGLNGLALHAVNDTPHAIDAEVGLRLYREGSASVAQGVQALHIPAHGSVQVRGDALLGRFTDSTYRYRFGPPGHDVAAAVLRDGTSGATLATDFFFPAGHGFAVQAGVGLETSTVAAGDGCYDVAVRTRSFAQAVRIEATGFRPDRNYLHIEPGGERTIRLVPIQPGARLRATVEALNSHERIRVVPPLASST